VKATTCRPYKTLGQKILGQPIVARNWYIQENDQRGVEERKDDSEKLNTKVP
jgi:hypothetical protein